MSVMGELSTKTRAMAFYSGQRDHDRLYFTPTTPQFFKVLLTDAVQHGKVKIPTKFVRNHGTEISSPVYLKVPSGAIWQVELAKSNDEIWLQSGWREFVEYHSLELQYIVLFRYEGNALFNVVIFDKSATEVEYPIKSSQAGIHNFNGQSQGQATEEEDASIQILDDMPPSKKRREKSPLPCPRLSRKMRIHSNTNRTESNAKLNTLASKVKCEDTIVSENWLEVPKRSGSSPWHTQGSSARGSNAARKCNGEVNASQKHRHRRWQKTLAGNEKAKALQRASSFKSQNPFFKAVMQPSSVTSRYRMYIPLKFSRKHLLKKHGKVLCVVDGKSWHMELVKYNSENKKHFKSELCNGWMKFSHDNNLNVGDVCVFELIKSAEITFNVVVFRREVEDSESLDMLKSSVSFESDDGNGASLVKSKKSSVTVYASRSKGAISSPHNELAAQKSQLPQGNFNQVRCRKTAGSPDGQGASSPRTLAVFAGSRNFAPEDPNCKVLVRSCHLTHGSLNLPLAFAKRFVTPKTRMVTLQVAERLWHVKLKSYGWRSFLTSGLSVFARDNSLLPDDICVFELINKNDALLRVSILKHVG